MKTKILLIALLLLTVGSFAQNRFTELFNEADSAFKFNTSASISRDSLSFGRYYTDSELFLMRYPFAQFLFAYEVECKMDSITERIHDPMHNVIWTDMGNGTFIGSAVDNCTYHSNECSIYEHYYFKKVATIPTFTGFIKWLRENFAPEPTGFKIRVQDKEFSVDLKK